MLRADYEQVAVSPPSLPPTRVPDQLVCLFWTIYTYKLLKHFPQSNCGELISPVGYFGVVPFLVLMTLYQHQ